MRKIGIGLTAALFIAAVAAPALATPPLPVDPPDTTPPDTTALYGHKVVVCHATSSSNPVQYWEAITVDIASSNFLKRVQGHVGHTDPDYAKKAGRLDLIPTFFYDQEEYGGYADPGNEGQWEIWSDLNEADAAACKGEEPGSGAG